MNNFDNLHEQYIESLVPDNDDLKLNGTFETRITGYKDHKQYWLDLNIIVCDDVIKDIELLKADISDNDGICYGDMDESMANELIKKLCHMELINKILEEL